MSSFTSTASSYRLQTAVLPCPRGAAQDDKTDSRKGSHTQSHRHSHARRATLGCRGQRPPVTIQPSPIPTSILPGFLTQAGDGTGRGRGRGLERCGVTSRRSRESRGDPAHRRLDSHVPARRMQDHGQTPTPPPLLSSHSHVHLTPVRATVPRLTCPHIYQYTTTSSLHPPRISHPTLSLWSKLRETSRATDQLRLASSLQQCNTQWLAAAAASCHCQGSSCSWRRFLAPSSFSARARRPGRCWASPSHRPRQAPRRRRRDRGSPRRLRRQAAAGPPTARRPARK